MRTKQNGWEVGIGRGLLIGGTDLAAAAYWCRGASVNLVGWWESLVGIDISWLRLSISGFGVGSYVKQIFYEDKIQKDAISAFRVSTEQIPLAYQNRLMFVVKQVSDAGGPMLSPNVYQGERAIG